ncbi:MAG: hypothetical protein ACJ76Y_09145 [Thermoanaerobaculia bacterium]
MAEDPLELVDPKKNVFLLGIEVWGLEEHGVDIWILNGLGADSIYPKRGL